MSARPRRPGTRREAGCSRLVPRAGGLCAVLSVFALLVASGRPFFAAAQPQPTASTQPVFHGSGVNIRLLPDSSDSPPSTPTFTARFTGSVLAALIATQTQRLPLPFSIESERRAYLDALDRIGMAGVVEQIAPYLQSKLPGQFSESRDLIRMPVPAEQQAEVEAPEGAAGPYRGPQHEIIGFLIHDVTETEFLQIAVRVMNLARQLLDTGHPRYDRTSPEYYQLLAAADVAELRRAHASSQAAAQSREETRQRIAHALGLTHDAQTNRYVGDPQWIEESRRFSYVLDDSGKFIQRVAPLVERYNRDLAVAGFAPPGAVDQPGIHFDPDLGEVEIILPAPMMKVFLTEADELERRMADEDVISVEAVRLTDSEIINGAIASRLSATVQGVHSVDRETNRRAFREFSVNSLLAVANNQLSASNLRGIEAGLRPEGVGSVVLPGLAFTPRAPDQPFTSVGSDFSIGADDIFFDGREQSYGFSYIGPDGLQHTLSLDVVDSLREFWDRIERNLIVHKIRKKVPGVEFRVPVGPQNQTVKGIAALIAQRDQQIVVATGTGAISTIEATAGTWLVIEDFEITALPGASTTLSSDEHQIVDSRVKMTMYLRDPQTQSFPDPSTIDLPEADVARLQALREEAPDMKTALVQARTVGDLELLLRMLFQSTRDEPIRPGLNVPTYGQVFERRRAVSLSHAVAEKREENSRITLSFYSSQGDIISQPGVTSLGASNELTSFTTELRPNIVTPISSFLTKDASGAKGASPLTGVSKGEQSSEEKNMTHLVIRVRFPTVERERMDVQEGRFVGYFELPLGRTPHSQVDLPFLSSSEHPLKRLSKLRMGLMFPVLQGDRVRKPLELINPNQLQGTVSLSMWETATTRMLMLRKIISDSLHADQSHAASYDQRFQIEVRSLLEYDPDFFDLPNIALRNTAQWNNPDRILVALNNSTGKFALNRLVSIIDELGEDLITPEYANRYLAVAERNLWGQHRLRPLTELELQILRRDVANHYLRLNETYGDQFLESVSMLFGLGNYNVRSVEELRNGPFRGYLDLVVLDAHESRLADQVAHSQALTQFTILRRGGQKGRLGEPSLVYLEHMPAEYRRMVSRGRDILRRDEWWQFLYAR